MHQYYIYFSELLQKHHRMKREFAQLIELDYSAEFHRVVDTSHFVSYTNVIFNSNNYKSAKIFNSNNYKSAKSWYIYSK